MSRPTVRCSHCGATCRATITRLCHLCAGTYTAQPGTDDGLPAGRWVLNPRTRVLDYHPHPQEGNAA